MTDDELLDQIRADRQRGELLGPLIDRYGSADVVRALGVMPIAHSLGLTDVYDRDGEGWADEDDA